MGWGETAGEARLRSREGRGNGIGKRMERKEGRKGSGQGKENGTAGDEGKGIREGRKEEGER